MSILDNHHCTRAALMLSVSLGALFFQSGPALAEEDSIMRLEEIVVTARKRAESLQDIPVNVSALSSETIQEQDLTSIEKIAARTPNLSVGRASNGSGAQITMRGIGSSSTSIGIEQSVAVVVDDVYYGQGRVINEGFFDVERVEILKGPQTLFFGKNATAGVIGLKTADPTDETEIIARASYEFKAEQIQLEAIGSGALSDTLGIRVAVRGSKMYGGYYENIADDVTYSTFDVATFATTPHVASPAEREAPGEEEILGRVTLKWDPSERLRATLKLSTTQSEVNNSSWNYVAFECPTGVSQLNGYACGGDFISHQNNIPADIAVDFPFSKPDGQLYNDYESYAVTGKIEYDFDNVTLTSVSNYQWNNNQWACACDFQSSAAGTWATENSTWRAFSSELRALTTFDGPINLMFGGLFQDTRRDFDQFIMFANIEYSLASPENRYLATTKTSFTDGQTTALFGQVTWDIMDNLELAGGVRYTHETKDSYFTQPYNNPGVIAIFRPMDDPDGLGEVTANQTFDDWSPEATLTWKATDNLMIYGAYKTAYKSGGFSNGGINSKFSSSPIGDLTFNPEKASGFEVGFKSTLLDQQLRLNLALYSYAYKDLQIDFFNSPIFAFQTLTADARTKGVEVEFEYAPAGIDGLNIYGSINYNHARYTDFPVAPCYAGQSIAEGCDLLVSGFNRQNLTGQVLSVAPDWVGMIGFRYETEISDGMRLGLNASARYSDSYLASAFGNDDSLQDDYVSVDAGVRVSWDDDKWELAVIGKNLTNSFYVNGVVDGPSTGGASGTATPAHADQLGFGNLPRTVRVQLTTRF